MKIQRRQTPDRSRRPCWCPSRRKATRRRVSNPDCAVDVHPHSRREQHPQSAAPSLIGGESPLRVRSLASCFFPPSTESTTVSRERLSWKAITDSRLGLDQRWFWRARLNFLAQMRDVNP